MSAFIERFIDERGPEGSVSSSPRIGAQSGRLSRALLPGQAGHVGRLGNPTAESLARAPFGVRYGIDLRVIPYAAAQEFGARIRATERMIRFFWAKYMSTGAEKWKWMALHARKVGIIRLQPRPFFNPGVDAWMKEQAPKEIARAQRKLIAVFNGKGT